MNLNLHYLVNKVKDSPKVKVRYNAEFGVTFFSYSLPDYTLVWHYEKGVTHASLFDDTERLVKHESF